MGFPNPCRDAPVRDTPWLCIADRAEKDLPNPTGGLEHEDRGMEKELHQAGSYQNISWLQVFVYCKIFQNSSAEDYQWNCQWKANTTKGQWFFPQWSFLLVRILPLYFESSWDPFVLFIYFMIFTCKQSKQNSTSCTTIIYWLVYFLLKEKKKKKRRGGGVCADWNHSRIMLSPVFTSLCLTINLRTHPCRPSVHPSVMLLITMQWLLMKTQSQLQWPGLLEELPAPAFGCCFEMPAMLWSPN